MPPEPPSMTPATTSYATAFILPQYETYFLFVVAKCRSSIHRSQTMKEIACVSFLILIDY